MVTSIHSLALLVAATLAAGSATAQDPAKPKPAPEEQTGLKVGEHAPGFTLKDQSGAERSLDDLLKNGPVALVFYRSADW